MGAIAFYLQAVMGCDPYESDDRSGVEDLSDELYSFLPEHFDAAPFRAYHVPLPLYGNHWSEEVIKGLQVLTQVPPDRCLTMRFEDFLTTSEESIKKLLMFIDPQLVDEAWIHRTASLVRPVRSSWQTLPAQEQVLLDQACQPGFQALEPLMTYEKLPERPKEKSMSTDLPLAQASLLQLQETPIDNVMIPGSRHAPPKHHCAKS
jgi:hypothetical protein